VQFEQIVAVGLLTGHDLDLLGPTFTRVWPVEEAPNFAGSVPYAIAHNHLGLLAEGANVLLAVKLRTSRQLYCGLARLLPQRQVQCLRDAIVAHCVRRAALQQVRYA
jgi:hypothetical protein